MKVAGDNVTFKLETAVGAVHVTFVPLRFVSVPVATFEGHPFTIGTFPSVYKISEQILD